MKKALLIAAVIAAPLSAVAVPLASQGAPQAIDWSVPGNAHGDILPEPEVPAPGDGSIIGNPGGEDGEYPGDGSIIGNPGGEDGEYPGGAL